MMRRSKIFWKTNCHQYQCSDINCQFCTSWNIHWKKETVKVTSKLKKHIGPCGTTILSKINCLSLHQKKNFFEMRVTLFSTFIHPSLIQQKMMIRKVSFIKDKCVKNVVNVLVILTRKIATIRGARVHW